MSGCREHIFKLGLIALLLSLPCCNLALDCLSAIQAGEVLLKQGTASRKWHTLDNARQAFLNATGSCNDAVSRQAEAYFKLGYVNLLLSSPTSAITALQASNQLDPTKPSVHLNLAVAWSQLRNYKTAGYQYLHHARIKPTAATESRLAAIKMLLRAGLLTEAAATWNMLVSSLSSLPCHQQASIHYELGRAQELNGYWLDANHHVSTSTLSNFSASLQLSRCSTITITTCQQTSQCHGSLVLTPSHRSLAILPATLVPIKDTRAVHLQTVSSATLVGNDGVIMLDPTTVLESDLMPQIPLYRNVPVIRTQFKPSLVHYPAAILAVQTFATGFYHFLLDVLPRILIAVHLHPNVPLLLPSNSGKVHRYMQELLELVGLDGYPRIMFDVLPRNPNQRDDTALATPRVSIGTLYRIQWSWPSPKPANYGFLAHYPPASVLNLLRRRLLGHYPCPTLHTVLYVQRHKAATRRLRNEHQLLDSIRKLIAAVNVKAQPSWRLDVMSDDPIPSTRDTLRKFQHAQVIIGVHGAGLSNVIVCPKEAVVIELGLWQPHAQYYRHLASGIGLSYHNVPLDTVEAYSQVYVDANHSSIISLLRSTLLGL
eukprot:m.79262 g.79262  ORF g.79262 m.79262 type:complete len:599 (-) comp14512_c0_seq2:102-1898(-)